MSWLLKSVIGESLPFTVKEKIDAFSKQTDWSMYDGKRVVAGTTEDVSIFKVDVKSATSKNAMKRLRVMRHPNILSFRDAHENKGDETMYIVTERVVPLKLWLSGLDDARASISSGGSPENDDESKKYVRRGSVDDLSMSVSEREAIHDKQVAAFVALGLSEVLDALNFVNIECKLVHGNVCPDSLFVDKSGSWRLGGFDLASEFNADKQEYGLLNRYSSYLSKSYQAPERASLRWGTHIPIWAQDAWSLGCIIEELHSNGIGIDSIKPPTKQMQQLIDKLKQKIPRKRPKPSKCLRAPYFRTNVFVSVMGELEQWTLKSPEQRIEIFKMLAQHVSEFPRDACDHKILPILLEALRIGDSPTESWGSWALAPLMQIALILSEKRFESEIVPAATKLFASNNRATRLQL